MLEHPVDLACLLLCYAEYHIIRKKNAFKGSSVGICMSASTLSPITSLLESTGFNDGLQQISTKNGRAHAADRSVFLGAREGGRHRAPSQASETSMMQQEDLG